MVDFLISQLIINVTSSLKVFGKDPDANTLKVVGIMEKILYQRIFGKEQVLTK
jgi:hypothetical protein